MNEFDEVAARVAQAAGQNPLDRAAAGVADQQRTALRSSLYGALLADPEVAARAQKLGRQTGLPADLVERNLPEVQRGVRLNEFDRFLQDSPAMARWLSDQQNARVAHDDTDNLSAVESAIRYLVSAPGAPRGGLVADAAGSGRALLSGVNAFNEGAWGVARAGAELLPDVIGKPLAAKAAQYGQQERSQAQMLMPKADSVRGAGWYSGLQSLGLNLLQLPAVIATGGGAGALGLMGAVTGGQAYGQARDQGVSQAEALLFGASQGVIEAGTEKIGMPALMSLLKPGAFASKALSYLVKEQGGEQIATHLQDLNEWAVLPENRDKTLADYLAARPDAALQTAIATAVGGGGQVAVMKVLGKVLAVSEASQGKARQAEQRAEVFAQLGELAAASKVAQRDADTFQDFIAQAADGGPVQDVYLDARTLQQSGLAEPLAQASPAVAEQLQAALQTGGDVRIPLDEYTARVAGTPLNQSLIDHLRVNPDDYSRAEAKQYMQEHGNALQAEVERAFAEQSADQAMRDGQEVVKQQVLGELNAAGRHTGAVNEAYAALVAARTTVRAAQLGITPQEMFEKQRLRVAAQAVGGHGFEQDGQAERARARILRKQANRTADAGKAAELHARADALDAQAARWEAEIAAQPGETGGARGTFTPGANVITLLQGADLSTFLHETGHFFFENDIALAAELVRGQREGASVSEGEQQILTDVSALFTWHGIAGDIDAQLREWYAMDFEQQRGFHERTAESFEAYLFSGQAPSVELQRPFQHFRAWLVNVYRSLRDFLTRHPEAGTLNDEVRGVFDRMLASTEQIQLAEQSRSLMGLFTAPGQAGLTEDGVKSMHSLGLDATQRSIEQLQARSLRDMKWLSGARSRTLKRLQAGAEGLHREVRMGAKAEVMSQPVYRAWQFLTGKIDAGDKLPAPERRKSDPNVVDPARDSLHTAIAKLGGLRKDEAIAQWGTDPKDKPVSGVFGKPVWRVEGGRSIDDMAEALGELGYLPQDDSGRVDIRDLEERFYAELRGEPVYSMAHDYSQAQGEERAGEGVNAAALMAGRFDLVDLKALGLPEEVVARVQSLKMTAKAGGLHPDIVASVILAEDGQPAFGSGDELVRALAAATPPREAIEALTDQRMLEQHADLSSPEALERAVDAALHNEARTRLVAAELQALQDAMNPRGAAEPDRLGRARTAALLPKAAREFAAQMVGRLRVRDIKPSQYSAAESRAARAAAKALQAGDIAQAAAEKRNELINTEAARAAIEALDEVERIDRFFRSIATRADSKVGKSRDMDVVNAARAVLANFGYGAKAKTAAEYLESVRAYDPALHEVLIQSVQAAEAMAAPGLRDLTLEQVRGLRDEVESLWHVAKRNKQLEVDGNLLDREEAAAELGARLAEIGVPAAMPGQDSAITPEEVLSLRLKGVRAIGRRVEFWVDRLDGDNRMGAFRRLVFNPIKLAADRYRADKAAHLRQFRAMLDAVAPTMKRQLIAAPELGYTFGKDSGGVALNEILHALLHTGNDSNKRKLLLGREWAAEMPDGTLDTGRWDAFVARMVADGKLTEAHFDFVQGVWDLLEGTKSLAQKAHRDAYGRYFDEVAADGFTDPFGRVRRGGYAPAMADSRIVTDKALKKLLEEGKEALAYAFPATSKGFTKARVEYNRPLMLDLRTLPQHIDRVLLFSYLENPARDVSRLLADGGVSGPLNRIDPAAIDHMLMPWLNRSARQSVTTPTPGDAGLSRLLNAVRNRVGVSAMFGNLSNALQQVTGFMLASVKVPPRLLLAAAAQYAKGPRAMAQAVAAQSIYMTNRMDNEVAAMMGEVDAILLDPTLLQRGAAWTSKHAYFLQSAVDNVMGPIIWTGAFNDALEHGHSDADAALIADAAVRQTQGSTLPEDVSRIETGPAWARLFTQFQGYFNMQANLLGTEFSKLPKEMGLRTRMGRGFYIFMLGLYAPAAVAEAIAQLFRGGPGDEDKDGEWLDDWLMALFVTGPMRNLSAFIPFVGPVVNSAINRFNGNPTDDKVSSAPAVGAIEGAAGVPFDLYKAAVGEGNAQRTVRDVATLVSITTGLPANLAARPVGYLAGVAQGKTGPTGPLDAARGLVTGVASQGSRER